MRKQKLSLKIAKVLSFCFFFSTIGFASSKVVTKQSGSLSHNPIVNSHSDSGMFGPLAVGINRSSLTNVAGKVQYTQKFYESFAVSGLLEYGNNMYRYGGTIGMRLLDHSLFKFSVECLSEVLPFSFDSGDINQRMNQNAYGVEYQYVFDNDFLQGINVGGYHAKVPSQNLDQVTYLFNGMTAINSRRIAGGTSKGINMSASAKLTRSTLLTARLNYDDLHYDTVFSSTSDYNSHGLGGGVKVNQIISDNLNFMVETDVRKIYNAYKFRLAWLPPFDIKFPFEIAVVGQHLVSHNPTPNSDSIGFQLAFNPALLHHSRPHCALLDSPTNKIDPWTSVPAVYMDRVLAIAEQQTTTPSVTTYTVTYDSNDASGNPPSGGSYPANAKVTVSDGGALYIDGKVFAGWNTAASGAGTQYSQGNIFIITSNIILYAMWSNQKE